MGPRIRQQRWNRFLLRDGRFAEIYCCFDGSHHSGESNALSKECNHESTIAVGLVPHSSSPLSLYDVSGDSIRAVAHALILCAGQTQSIDRCSGRKNNTFSSPAQHRLLAGEDDHGQSGWSNPGRDALSFLDLNCAVNKNNKSGELRKWQRKQNWGPTGRSTWDGRPAGEHQRGCGWPRA